MRQKGMQSRKDLASVVERKLNLTLPAVLRGRSVEAYQQLHKYAKYEQWYNAELIMHLQAELGDCWVGDRTIRVRGEACIAGRKVDWAFVASDARDDAHRFTPDEVLAFGESKVCWSSETALFETLLSQVGSEPAYACPRFGYVVVPSDNPKLLAARVSDLDRHFRGATGSKEKLGAQHLQVISGYPFPGANEHGFCLTQIVFRHDPPADWRVLCAPLEHAFPEEL